MLYIVKYTAVNLFYCRIFDNIKLCAIKNNKDILKLNNYFGNHSKITLEDLRQFFRKDEPKIPDATINWRVYNLVQSSALHRIGRGLFQLGVGNQFRPALSSRATKINKLINKNFSDVTFCVWNSDLLNEFAQHLTGYPFILVDVEKDVAESVCYFLRDNFNGVFLRPPMDLFNNMLPEFRQPIIVRYLPTESPLNEQADLPMISLEKMLVDVFCDMEFNFLEGSERRAIFSNAYYKYTINENKLLRYAARKGRRHDIHKYIHQGGFAEQKS